MSEMDTPSIRDRRMALGWTQAQLAEAAGLRHAAYVSSAERGLAPDAVATREIEGALEVEERRREWMADEEAGAVKRRALADAVPHSPEWGALRAAIAERAMALLDAGNGGACDALLELIPEDQADRLLSDWLDAQTPEPQKDDPHGR